MYGTVAAIFRLIGRQRRRRFLIVWLFATLVTGLEAVSAVLVLVLMRLVLEPGTVPQVPMIGDPTRWFPSQSYEELVLGFAVMFAAFFLLRAVLFLAQEYGIARVSENTGVILAHRLVAGYLTMPYGFHLRRNSAELVRNAYDNVQELVRYVLNPMATLVAESILVVALLGVLLVASPLATLAAAGLMGLTVLAMFAFVQPRLKLFGKRRQEGARSAIQHLQQALGGLRDIKVLHRERSFSESFRRARREMAEASNSRHVLMYVPRVSIETSFLLFVLGVLVVGVMRGSAADVLPVLGLFAYAGVRLQPSLQKIAAALNNFRYAETIVGALLDDFRLIESSTAGTSQEDDHPHATTDALEPLPVRREIRFEDVTFRYEDDGPPALEHVNIAIRKGESIGIAGATGGGKTTLLDLLCGLLIPTDGTITVDGVDLSRHTRAWQRNIGVVHQSSFLIDDTLRANVAFGVPDHAIDHELLWGAIEMAELTDVVKGLPDGIDTFVGERGIRLSGGQRQRVALARALYRQPRLLILDEGTSALDNATEARVIENLQRLHGDTTLVMVAHRLTTIMRCDRILFLENGHVRAAGTYEELKRHSPSFRAMAV